MIFSFAGLPIIIGMQRAVRYLHRRNDRVLRGSRQRVNEMLRNLATVRMFARENQEIVVSVVADDGFGPGPSSSESVTSG